MSSTGILICWFLVVTAALRLAAKPPYCYKNNEFKSIRQRNNVTRSKGLKSWPYDCTHASLVKHGGLYFFMTSIHSCCQRCNFPAFTSCVLFRSGPSWRCPSEAFHCIVNCVKKYDINPFKSVTRKKSGTLSRIGQGRKRRLFRKSRKHSAIKRVSNPKCEKQVTRDGKICVERLCIPLKV